MPSFLPRNYIGGVHARGDMEEQNRGHRDGVSKYIDDFRPNRLLLPLLFCHTEMPAKAKARLSELALTTRGSYEEGFTQSSLCIFLIVYI